MQALYITIFASDVALAGIVMAAVVGYAQIVSNQFSPRLGRLVTRDRGLMLLYGLMGALLLVAGFGAIASTASEEAPVRQLVEGLPMQVGVTIAMAALLAVLYVVLLRLSSYADPSRLPTTIMDEIAPGELALTAMAESRRRDRPLHPSSEAVFESSVEADPDVDKWLQDLAETSRAAEEYENTADMYLRRHPPKSDPLQPLTELIQRAVAEGDRLLVEEILRRLATSIPDWLSRIDAVGPFKRETLQEALLDLILRRHLTFFLETLRVRQVFSPISEVTGLLVTLERELSRNPALLDALLAFHADSCEHLIEWHQERLAAENLQGLFTFAAATLEAGEHELFDEACRRIGRAGELIPPNLIHRGVVQPMMPTHAPRPDDIADVVVNGLHELGRALEAKLPKPYPLIFADAVEVTILALIRRVQDEVKNDSLDPMVMALVAILGELGTAAAQKEDGHTTYLCLAKLSIVADELPNGVELLAKVREYVATRIARLGVWARACNVIESGPVWKWAAQLLETFEAELLRPIMMEVFTGSLGRNEVTHDARWDFIRDVGRRVHSNFGLMFDPETGELFAEDDPRRR